ncbi:unnamed protein product [Cuscuta europaea]|uniref:CCHC-type domain-containing protein n=1 Tax=Cuscuta europaea TaxID=41803 RepID=A0A9P0Z966_CUSEU|nr:unnamed protein product [Cuscuta europaea]
MKHWEYTNLKQRKGATIKQLEQEFRILATFLHEYAADEDRMTEHFLDTLHLDIRNRATYSCHMTFSEVVEPGMLGETQWNERKTRDGIGSLRPPAQPAKKNRDARWHGPRPQNLGAPRCPNCTKQHFGKCNEPPRCFKCRNAGHMKPNFPQVTQDNASGAGGGIMTGRNHAGPSHGGTGRGGASTSNTVSVNQGGAQARVYAMTEADARANPTPLQVIPC